MIIICILLGISVMVMGAIIHDQSKSKAAYRKSWKEEQERAYNLSQEVKNTKSYWVYVAVCLSRCRTYREKTEFLDSEGLKNVDAVYNLERIKRELDETYPWASSRC